MQVRGIESLASPSLLFDEEAILWNLDRMVEIVHGDTSRLRPHAKTHKCAEILALQLERGITRSKCATLSECALAARTGVPDILLSFPAIGPAAKQLFELSQAFPETQFSTLIDSEEGYIGLEELGESGLSVYLDLDVGMSRTGIPPGEKAITLIQRILDSPHLNWAGIHAYDGHIHEADLGERRRAFEELMAALFRFLEDLDAHQIVVPNLVSGGSPTFAMHAELALASDRSWECSPGTPLLWDAGYEDHYPELGFRPAAFLLTRVVSHPGEDLACLDLGHKAVSGENPIQNRVRFPDLSEHEFVSQSEEHLVLRFPFGMRPPIGMEVYGIPYHVCPTVALHEEAHLLREHRVSEVTWKIAARNRKLDY